MDECGCGKPVTYCSECATRHFHIGMSHPDGSFHEVTVCVHCDGMVDWPLVRATPGLMVIVQAALADAHQRRASL